MTPAPRELPDTARVTTASRVCSIACTSGLSPGSGTIPTSSPEPAGPSGPGSAELVGGLGSAAGGLSSRSIRSRTPIQTAPPPSRVPTRAAPIATQNG